MTEELDRVLQTRVPVTGWEYLSITWTSLEAIIGVAFGMPRRWGCFD